MIQTTAEQRVVLDPCSWETYERILDEHIDSSSPRFTYADGALEIMSPGPDHEKLSFTVATLVVAVCEELDIDWEALGSTTQRRKPQQKGVEPDSSFYFGSVDRDPYTNPPDLMVEVEISRSALNKLPICATLGVPEVWRCDYSSLTILHLRDGNYEPGERSQFLPVSAADLTLQIKAREGRKRNAWLRGVREWARGLNAES